MVNPHFPELKLYYKNKYNMNKAKIYSFCLPLLAGLILVSGCKKDDGNGNDLEPETSTTAEITVKNASGDPQSDVMVYLFENASTETDGSDPAKALKSALTGQDGIAKFDLKDVTEIESGETFYFTAIQELPIENKVLASTEALITIGKVLKMDLIIISINEPNENGYAFGFIPTTVTTELAMSEYERWKSTQVVACGDGFRVIADPSDETRVEAIGFGMLLAAYAEDKETFDGLHRFYNSKRTTEANNMMAWLVTCNGINDPGSATDGDADVAFALIVASKHWGDAYLDASKEILQVIKENVILSCTVDGQSIKILGPGYSNGAWGGCGQMDIMYHTPAFFRIFADITGDETWDQLADDTYITLDAGAHPTTGLVPDWQTASGTPGPGGRAGHYGYDACRAPWKLTLDYLWNGNTQAEAWASKISTWSSQEGPTNIVDGYELDGTPRGTNKNSAFLGGFAVAQMANSQSTVNQFGTALSKLQDSYWFNINTRCLYLFTLTGNFWDPTTR